MDQSVINGNNYLTIMKKRTNAILWCAFLGGLGAHKFYLGKPFQGVLYLIFSWTFVPLAISIIEFVLLVIMSNEDFDIKYNPQYVKVSE